MSKKWKEFEKLATRIEKALSPLDAEVKWNDRIPDLVTGSKRQVDGSIRYTVGTTPLLITIECRKRKDKSDDTWIEQLIAKKQKLGAAKTIAVSESGISRPAMTSAAMYGIEVRRIADITNDVIRRWVTVTCKVLRERFRVRRFSLDIEWPEGGDARVKPELLQELRSVGSDARIFKRAGKPYSLSDIVKESSDRGTPVCGGLEIGERRIRVLEVAYNKEGLLAIDTLNGERNVRRAKIEVEAVMDERDVKTGEKQYEYSDSSGILVNWLEHSAEFDGRCIKLFAHRNPDSDEVQILAESDDIDMKSGGWTKLKGEDKS